MCYNIIKFKIMLVKKERITAMIKSNYTNLIDLNDMPPQWWLKVVKLASDIFDDPASY